MSGFNQLNLKLSADIKELLEDPYRLLVNRKDIKDLTYLKTYAIDDINTVEIDDALSFERVNNHTKLWIHISSPTEFIRFNSNIDLLARNRSSSIYLPGSKEYMYPIDLITRVFSLEISKESVTLSVGVILDETGEIKSYEVCRGIIKCTYKLSYEDADDILDISPKEEIDLVLIANLMKKRLDFRRKKGAIIIDEPYGRFYIDNDQPSHKIYEITNSRKLVSESMILYGTIIADYCTNNNIDVPYRIQQNIKCKTHNGQVVSNNIHLNNFILKQKISRSYLSLNQASHSSLGVSSYLQVTAPIRRYVDILSHYQVLSYILNDSPIISKDLLLTLIDSYNINYTQCINRMRNANNATAVEWFLLNDDLEWNALFLKWLNKSKGLSLLYFKELEMDILTRILPVENLDFGTELRLKLKSTNSKDQILEFTHF